MGTVVTDGLRLKVAAGLVWSFVQILGSRVLTFVIFLVLARLLGPADFGIVAVVTVTIMAVYGLIDHGLCDALVQRLELDDEHHNTAFWSVAGAGLAAFLAVCAAAPFAASELGQPQLLTLLPLMALTLPIGALGMVHEAQLRRRFEFRSMAMRSMVMVLSGGVTAVAMAVEGYGFWSLAGKSVVESLTSTLMLWYFNRWRPRIRFSRAHWHELFNVGRHLLVGRSLDVISQRADSFLIGWKLGAVQVGLYAVGQRVFQLMMDTTFSAIQQVALPAFSRLQGEKGRVAPVFLRTVRVAGCFAFPIFTLIAASSGDLVIVLFGAKWADTAPILCVFAIGGLLFTVSYFNSALLTAMGRADLYLRMVALNAVVNLVGFIIGLHWGAVGVATAFVVRGYLLYPVGLFYLKQVVGLPMGRTAGAVAPFLGCAVGCAALAYSARHLLVQEDQHITGVLLTLLTGIATYVALCWVVARNPLRLALHEVESMHPRVPRLCKILRLEKKSDE